MTRWFGLLHGHIVEGSKLLHSYAAFRRRATHASCYRRVVCGADIYKCGGADPCGGQGHPYIVMYLEVGNGQRVRIARTHSVVGSTAPVWNTEFSAFVDTSDDEQVFVNEFCEDALHGPMLTMSVFDDDGGGNQIYNDDLLGLSKVPLKEVAKTKTALRVELTVRHPLAKTSHDSHSKVVVHFRWFPFQPNGPRVPNSYFRRSHGNMVTLYHDAYCHPGDSSDIQLGGDLKGHAYKAQSCWDDIYRDIVHAQKLVYIAGWSVNTATRLQRNFTGAEQPETLGELLKRKAEEDVHVIVLVWSDVTSVAGLGMKDGLMGTYDQWTKDYFAGTKVDCILARRRAADDVGSMLGPFLGALKGTAFTHHQKIILCDGVNEWSSNKSKRVLVSYVGGLDLTSGRYDTGRHELFGTLENAHRDDFYNGCCVDANATCGPREPWHDIHSRVVGPASWDVYQTLSERLAKQAPIVHLKAKALINELRADKVIRDTNTVLIHPSDPRAWDVQIFRSLDSESAVFNNQKFINRFDTKKCMVDRGVQSAYLYLIDTAKKYIYIENQYFLGSAQYWLEHNDVPATNLVPYEIARRICRAIGENEEFCVYILTPLFPEGPPGSMSVQEILHWQYQTMRFMYRRIADKLRSVGSTTHPSRYLQFYFPGKREIGSGATELPAKISLELSNALRLKRFVIYVHSKMMIVDDAYIILGSANINDRSMAGCRDTEIAAGAYQTAFQATLDETRGLWTLPQGDVSAFRKQLWEEHFGAIVDEFEDPSSKACAEKCRDMALENWIAFSDETAETPVKMPHGHMCVYPHKLQANGDLVPNADYPNIPNTIAPLAGYRSAMLPGPVTT